MNFNKGTEMNITPFTAHIYKNKFGYAFDIQIDGRLFSKNPRMETNTREECKIQVNEWAKSMGKSVIIL